MLAKQIKAKFGTNLSFAITGEAGPVASSNHNEVGTAFLSLVCEDSFFDRHLELKFKGDRNFLKKRFAQSALSLIYDVLKEIEKKRS